MGSELFEFTERQFFNFISAKKKPTTVLSKNGQKSYVGHFEAPMAVLWDSLTYGDDLTMHWRKFTVKQEEELPSSCSVVFW